MIALCLMIFTYGLGCARLMSFLVGTLLTRIAQNRLIKEISVVLGWFLGGGVAYVAVNAVHFSQALGVKEADAFAASSYLAGLGAGLLRIDRWSRTTLYKELERSRLSDLEIETFVLIFRFGIEPDSAWKLLNLTKQEFSEVLKSTLEKINSRAGAVQEAINKRGRRQRGLGRSSTDDGRRSS